jgi:hypothetical protein
LVTGRLHALIRCRFRPEGKDSLGEVGVCLVRWAGTGIDDAHA